MIIWNCDISLWLILIQGGLIALLLLILLFTLVLYTRQRWCRRRRAPQKSASTEATHEIHYIPSVLLGPQSRDSFRGPRPLQHTSVIGMPIRETPILDDCDCEDDEQPGHLLDGKAHLEDDLCSQGTHSVDSLGKVMGEANHKHSLDNRGKSFSITVSLSTALSVFYPSKQ